MNFYLMKPLKVLIKYYYFIFLKWYLLLYFGLGNKNIAGKYFFDWGLKKQPSNKSRGRYLILEFYSNEQISYKGKFYFLKLFNTYIL